MEHDIVLAAVISSLGNSGHCIHCGCHTCMWGEALGIPPLWPTCNPPIYSTKLVKPLDPVEINWIVYYPVEINELIFMY